MPGTQRRDIGKPQFGEDGLPDADSEISIEQRPATAQPRLRPGLLAAWARKDPLKLAAQSRAELLALMASGLARRSFG